MLDNIGSPRECGECSLYCKLTEITEDDDPSIAKPIGEWCKHCRPGNGGCSIYESRPKLCRDFQCLWRSGLLEDHWKPLECRMLLLAAQNGLGVHVDEGAHGRWRRSPYYSDLLEFAKALHASGRHVWIYEYSRNRRVAFALNARGDSLEVPEDHKLVFIEGVPLMRIHQDLQAAFDAGLPWMMDPFRRLYEGTAWLDPFQRDAALKHGNRPAMKEFKARIRERGWSITKRDISRASDANMEACHP